MLHKRPLGKDRGRGPTDETVPTMHQAKTRLRGTPFTPIGVRTLALRVFRARPWPRFFLLRTERGRAHTVSRWEAAGWVPTVVFGSPWEVPCDKDQIAYDVQSPHRWGAVISRFAHRSLPERGRRLAAEDWCAGCPGEGWSALRR